MSERSLSRRFSRRQIIGGLLGATIGLSTVGMAKPDQLTTPHDPPGPSEIRAKKYLESLPLVDDTHEQEFIEAERKKFPEIVADFERVDGRTLRPGQTLKWLGKLTMGNDWTIKVEPLPPDTIPHPPSKSENFSMQLANVLDSNTQGDGLLFSTDPEEVSQEEKVVWKLSPPVAKNSNISTFDKSGDEVVALTDNVIHLAITSDRKKYINGTYIGFDGKVKHARMLDPATSVIAQSDIKLDIKWYTGDKLRSGIVSREPKDSVVNESLMDPVLYAKIKAKSEFYRKYSLDRQPVTIISKRHVDGGAVYAEGFDTIMLPENYLDDETAYDHENAHALLHALRDQKNAEKKVNKFEDLVAEIDESIQPNANTDQGKEFDPCNKSYAKVFETFDESTYEHNGCKEGHPGRNSDELFASGYVVLRFHAEQMVQNYEKLNDESKAHAKRIVESLLDLTDTLSHIAKQPALIPADSPVRALK